jgi:hypothetical protein
MGGVQWGGGLYTLGIGSDHRDALDGNRGSDFFEAFTPPHPFLVLYTSVSRPDYPSLGRKIYPAVGVVSG